MTRRWLLIVSPVGEQLGRVAYLVGDLAATNPGLRFVPVSGGLVDHGHDFYAATEPVAETTVLHQTHFRKTLTSQSPPLPLPSGPVDLVADVHATQGSRVRLELAETMALELDLVNGSAQVLRDVYDATRREWVTRATFPPSGNHRQLRIIIDGSIVEVFVNDGPTFTERLYPTGPPNLVMRGDEGARCEVVVRRLVSPSASTGSSGPPY